MRDVSDIQFTSSSSLDSGQLVVAEPFTLCTVPSAELARICGIGEDVLEDAYPVTPLQQGLMTITSRQTDAFTAREIFRLADHLDPNRLRHAINAIARDFPILRTRLIQASSEHVLQVVLKDVVEWDFSTSLDEFVERDQAQPMAYGLPVWRFAMIDDKKSGGKYLCWTAHHAG